MQSDGKKILRTLSVPIGAGVIAGGLSYLLNGNIDTDLLGMTMKAHIAIGASVAGSSLVAESIQQYVPSFPQAIANFTKPILTGAVSTAVMSAGVPLEANGMYIAFAVGAGSEIGGQYLSDKLITPYL